MTTTMMRRPSLHALVKEAMEGTANQVDITAEAMFLQENVGQGAPAEVTKQASADTPDVVPTEYIDKLAGALDYLSKQAAEGTTSLKPGTGPGALEVMEATSNEDNIETNDTGQANTQIPTKPPMQSSGVAKDPSNALQTNDEMQHPEQPVDPMSNEKTSQVKLVQKNLERLKLAGKLPPALKAQKIPKGTDLDQDGQTGDAKTAGANLLARNLMHLGLSKQAEDAINPASISSGKTQTGATPPEGASPSEEQVPSEPSDVNKQKSMVGSNDAAINYTKGQAKADPKSDVNKVLKEPALTSATDKVLQKTLDHTGQAGVKISSVRRDLVKTAASQALLSKLAKEAAEEKKARADKKEKKSQMGGLSTPSGQSGFTASSMGM